jgi:adenosine/AMP kinase
MTLFKTSFVIILYHQSHFIKDHQELVEYLHSFSTKQEYHVMICQFKNQIMNIHANIENLVYEFVEFLDRNSLYSEMIIKKEE